MIINSWPVIKLLQKMENYIHIVIENSICIMTYLHTLVEPCIIRLLAECPMWQISLSTWSQMVKDDNHGLWWHFGWNMPLRWRHNGCNSVSNHQPRECLLRRLIRRTSKKISKLRVTGLCAGNSPETGEFPAQMASNAENVSIWWRHDANGLCATDVKWKSWPTLAEIMT